MCVLHGTVLTFKVFVCLFVFWASSLEMGQQKDEEKQPLLLFICQVIKMLDPACLKNQIHINCSLEHKFGNISKDRGYFHSTLIMHIEI